MTLVITEMRKWKRSRMLWCILSLTAALGALAIERACSISRASQYMDSFGDLYTLAFKNLTSLFLPIVLGMFGTALFFEEKKNDTLKQLLIIPVSKTQLFFAKAAVIELLSLLLCLCTYLFSILGSFLGGGFPDLTGRALGEAALLYLTGGIFIPVAMLPVIFLATLSGSYILPLGATLLYLVPVVLAPAFLCGLHPLASLTGLYPHISGAAAEMVQNWTGGGKLNVSPLNCLLSLLLIGGASAAASVIAMRKQSY